MVAYGHAHPRAVGCVVADPVEDESVDGEYAARRHGHGDGLLQNAARLDPILFVDIVQHLDSGEQMGAGHNKSAAIVQCRFLEVEEHRNQTAAPLYAVAMEFAFVGLSEIEGGVVVAVLDDFDIGSKEGLEGVEQRGMGCRLAENGVSI